MKRSSVADVAIIGAGPAGASAAIRLANAGRRVVLVDKARFPRDKSCGDGLTTGALRELEDLGLAPNTLPSWRLLDQISLRSPSGFVVELPFRNDDGIFAGVVRRIDLDLALVELAKQSGATVIEGDALVELKIDNDSAAAQLASGAQVHASSVIAADGAHSTARRLIGEVAAQSTRTPRPRTNADWFAYRAYFDNVTTEAGQKLWVLFEREFLPGYVWSFPLASNVANVGVCVLRQDGERGATMASTWKRVLTNAYLASILGEDARLREPARAWPIPSRADSSFALGGRVLYVGDALRAGDPLTGEGVAQALESSRVATSAIIESPSPLEAAIKYATNLSSGLYRDKHVATVLSRVLSIPVLTRLAVRLCGLNAWSARNAGRFLYEDYARHLVLSPATWPTIKKGRAGPFSSLDVADKI